MISCASGGELVFKHDAKSAETGCIFLCFLGLPQCWMMGFLILITSLEQITQFFFFFFGSLNFLVEQISQKTMVVNVKIRKPN